MSRLQWKGETMSRIRRKNAERFVCSVDMGGGMSERVRVRVMVMIMIIVGIRVRAQARI